MKALIFFTIALLGFSSLAYSKGTEADAAKSADSFLAGLKIASIPEGKQIMRDTSWPTPFIISRGTPVVLEYTTIYQGLFDTDVPGIQGYKRLLDFKIQSEAGTVLTKRYILISYKDRKSGVWKVFDVRDLGSSSAENEIATCTGHCGYWLTFGGKLQKAKKDNIDAGKNAEVQILQAIIGE